MILEDRVKKLGLDPKRFTVVEKDGLLELSLKIDIKRYKNRISSYSEILKEHFGQANIFVLSRIKERKGWFTILFANSKESVMSEIKTFSPNYLIKKNNTKLLVTFENDIFKVFELPKYECTTFTFRKFIYKVANEIKLK